jgi:hypothetical protein
MAKDKDTELTPDPLWADRLQPEQQSEDVEEEETEPLSPEQGPSEA